MLNDIYNFYKKLNKWINFFKLDITFSQELFIKCTYFHRKLCRSIWPTYSKPDVYLSILFSQELFIILHIFTGSCAGAFGQLIASPMDLAKVKMQTRNNSTTVNNNYNVKGCNMFCILKQIYKKRGLFSVKIMI